MTAFLFALLLSAPISVALWAFVDELAGVLSR
jgi:hypothetical protein